MSSQEQKTYLGSTTAEAMEMVKADLGDDAVLTNQRLVVELTVTASDGSSTVKITGTNAVEAAARAQEQLGRDMVILAQRDMVEFTAGPAVDDGLAVGSGAAKQGAAVGRGANLLQRTYGAGGGHPLLEPLEELSRQERVNPHGTPVGTGPAGNGVGALDHVLSDIQGRLEEIERLARRTDRPTVPDSLMELYLTLVENEVSEDLARHLVEKIHQQMPHAAVADRGEVRGALQSAIARLIPTHGAIQLRRDGEPTVVMMVGPTGVGKTTSIAKLATEYKVHHRCKVGLITEDTSRPGGMEQLRSVAQLLSIPLTVADTVDRIRREIRNSEDRDIIFVDTAGRVPRNEQSLRELSRFVDAVEPDEVHLAVCSLAGGRHILDVVERFETVKFDRIMLTKLDEASTFGVILNMTAHVDKGLSYMTTGQGYMENIEPVDAGRLAGLVLGDELKFTRR